MLVTMFSGNVLAFNDTHTHRKLSELAVDKSVIKQYLRDNLDFPNGIDTEFGGKKAMDWITEGSQLEDKPACRANNHFHDPDNNIAWPDSGLSDRWWLTDWICDDHWVCSEPAPYPPEATVSNVTWATGYTEPVPGNRDEATLNRNLWDWESAGDYFYTFLTATDENIRNEHMGKTLRSPGQVLHLIQDTAVPAHVRNDFISHLDFIGRAGSITELWRGNKFEAYVKLHNDNLKEWVDNYGGDVQSETSLTDFWDTDSYTGAAPLPDSDSLGLAEYTNLNFFSKYTIFNHYPYPSKDSTNIGTYLAGGVFPETVIAEDGIPDTTFYIRKVRDGEYIEHFVKPGYFTNDIVRNWNSPEYDHNYDDRVFNRTLQLDEECFKDYAAKLIPQAVRYSAGLLDYFFRGRIEIAVSDTGLYSFIPDPEAVTDPRTQGFKKITFLARNISKKVTDGEETPEEMTGGKLTLVIKYRLSGKDPFQAPFSPSPGEFRYIVKELGDNCTLSSSSFKKFEADLSAAPLPLWATDVYLYLVYRGKLGSEDSGIAAGFKDICEPTPPDLFNVTDRICIYDNIFDAGSEEAEDAVKKYRNADIYPHRVTNIFVRFSSPDNPLYAGSSDYDYKVAEIAPGAYDRHFILPDTADRKFGMSVRAGADVAGGWEQKDTYRHSGIKFSEYVIWKSGTEHQGTELPVFEKFRGSDLSGKFFYFIMPYPESYIDGTALSL